MVNVASRQLSGKYIEIKSPTSSFSITDCLYCVTSSILTPNPSRLNFLTNHFYTTTCSASAPTPNRIGAMHDRGLIALAIA